MIDKKVFDCGQKMGKVNLLEELAEKNGIKKYLQDCKKYKSGYIVSYYFTNENPVEEKIKEDLKPSEVAILLNVNAVMVNLVAEYFLFIRKEGKEWRIFAPGNKENVYAYEKNVYYTKDGETKKYNQIYYTKKGIDCIKSFFYEDREYLIKNNLGIKKNLTDNQKRLLDFLKKME